jgi:hypothetical protein
MLGDTLKVFDTNPDGTMRLDTATRYLPWGKMLASRFRGWLIGQRGRSPDPKVGVTGPPG